MGKMLFKNLILSLCLAARFIPVCDGIESDTTSSNLSRWLLPSPKEAGIQETMLLTHHQYKLDCNMELPPSALKWLKEGLKQKINWTATEDAETGYSISISRIDKPGNNTDKEFYTLEISSDKIKIGACSEAGAYRAIGRLLCIMGSPLVEILPDSSVKCPGIKITDWPDFPMRGMELRLGYSPYNSNADTELIKHELDVMAQLGFNFVVLEVGGAYESATHPECTLAPRWSKKQLEELVAYAKDRGLMPLPGINSIGHLKTGPVICPLYENGNKNIPIISNIADPDYYKIYFEMLDELIDLFDSPPFVHIGTDEFSHNGGCLLLEKTTGKRADELYADFLNTVSRHLKAKKIRPVIWHDMLIDEEKFKDKMREAANGNLTWRAFEKIDKEIIIDYWFYYPRDNYNILEDIAKKGFDIWISPWKDPKGIERLCTEGLYLKAKAVMGTCWNVKPYLGGFPATAEFSWNAQRKSDKSLDIFRTYNMIFFYGRGTKQPPSKLYQIKTLSGTRSPSREFLRGLSSFFQDGKMNFSGIPLSASDPKSFFSYGITSPMELPPPYDFKKLTTTNPQNILLSSSSSFAWFSPFTAFNKEREQDDCIIYTPAYGARTGTNKSGCEIAVADGKILSLSGWLRTDWENGNLPIPGNGFVISAHGKINRGNFEDFIWDSSISEGDNLKLLIRNTQEIIQENVSISFRKETKNFIVFLTTVYPIDPQKELGKIVLEMSDKKKNILILNGSIFFEPRTRFQNEDIKDISSGKWKTWVAWTPPTNKLNSRV